MADPNPSAMMPPLSSLSVGSRSAPPIVMPEISPTVSMVVMNAIMHIRPIRLSAAGVVNSSPKCVSGKPNQLALLMASTFLLFIMPNGIATT